MKVIIIKENAVQSFTKDLVTFSWLIGGQFLNYKYVGNSNILTITLSVSFFLFVIATSKKEEKTIEQAEEFLKRLKDGQ